ncbi:unnamed protein product [Blepharisma stoltei]|uniref:Uncharacterized protein n=1 Tax=Blepharisma stoltei TaxID=1481888 RepID=A0AAU9IQ13_9CILI|nr:unnamed protein product [Blepharisma stoltei]
MDKCVRADIINPKLDVPLIIKKIQSQRTSQTRAKTQKEYFPYIENYASSQIPTNKSFSIADGSLKFKGQWKNVYENHAHDSTLKHSDGKFTIRGMLSSERKDLQSMQCSFRSIKSKPSQDSVKRMKSFDSSWAKIIQKTNLILSEDKPKMQKIERSSKRRFFSYKMIKRSPSPFAAIDQKLDPPSVVSTSSKFHSKYPELAPKPNKSAETSTFEKYSDIDKPIISIETKFIPKKTIDVKMSTEFL